MIRQKIWTLGDPPSMGLIYIHVYMWVLIKGRKVYLLADVGRVQNLTCYCYTTPCC